MSETRTKTEPTHGPFETAWINETYDTPGYAAVLGPLPNRLIIAHVQGSELQAQTDAKQIVRAVNNYEALVEVAKLASEMGYTFGDLGDPRVAMPDRKTLIAWSEDMHALHMDAQDALEAVQKDIGATKQEQCPCGGDPKEAGYRYCLTCLDTARGNGEDMEMFRA